MTNERATRQFGFVFLQMLLQLLLLYSPLTHLMPLNTQHNTDALIIASLKTINAISKHLTFPRMFEFEFAAAPSLLFPRVTLSTQ